MNKSKLSTYLKRKRPSKKQTIQYDPQYVGPLRTTIARRQRTTLKKFGAYYAPATSTVGGIISSAFVVSPATLDDWGNLQKDWAEYRILGFEVEYVSNHLNSYVSGIADGLLVMAVDRTSTTAALASIGAALDFEGAQYGPTNSRFKIKAKASGPNELAWVNITTSTYWASIRCYSASLSNSYNYGAFVVNILVEFRGLV
jgi:hypothetical protein